MRASFAYCVSEIYKYEWLSIACGRYDFQLLVELNFPDGTAALSDFKKLNSEPMISIYYKNN